MHSRITDEERAAIRSEALAEVRNALDGATDFEGFRDAMEENDGSLPGLTRSEIAGMTEDQINENWSAVSRVLEEGDAGDLHTPQAEPPPGGRRATGQQMLHEHTPAPERTAITKASLATMSHEEIVSRKAEIDAWLASGGASR